MRVKVALMAKRRKSRDRLSDVPPRVEQGQNLNTDIIGVVRRLSGVAILPGLAMLRYWFWGGVVVVYFGAVGAFIEIRYEPPLRRHPILQIVLLCLAQSCCSYSQPQWWPNEPR
jgi:hypothetical protein